MSDYLLRATAMEGKVRAFAVQTTAIVEELRQKTSNYTNSNGCIGTYGFSSFDDGSYA